MINKSIARERVLNAAEQLFLERGYNAVSMHDLANMLGMQKASLYHHAAQGKEALFIEVMSRILKRYKAGLENAIHVASEAGGFYAQLQGAAHWLLENPSLHYERMMQSDMPTLSPENVSILTRLSYEALLQPLEMIFRPEMTVRGIDVSKATYLAGAFLAVVESIHNLPPNFGATPKPSMADFLIEMLFKPFGKG